MTIMDSGAGARTTGPESNPRQEIPASRRQAMNEALDLYQYCHFEKHDAIESAKPAHRSEDYCVIKGHIIDRGRYSSEVERVLTLLHFQARQTRD